MKIGVPQITEIKSASNNFWPTEVGTLKINTGVIHQHHLSFAQISSSEIRLRVNDVIDNKAFRKETSLKSPYEIEPACRFTSSRLLPEKSPNARNPPWR